MKTVKQMRKKINKVMFKAIKHAKENIKENPGLYSCSELETGLVETSTQVCFILVEDILCQIDPTIVHNLSVFDEDQEYQFCKECFDIGDFQEIYKFSIYVGNVRLMWLDLIELLLKDNFLSDEEITELYENNFYA